MLLDQDLFGNHVRDICLFFNTLSLDNLIFSLESSLHIGGCSKGHSLFHGITEFLELEGSLRAI